MRGFPAVLLKEVVHIRRQRSTLFFMFVIPVIQMLIFGVALDTQVENIPAIVQDLDGYGYHWWHHETLQAGRPKAGSTPVMRNRQHANCRRRFEIDHVVGKALHRSAARLQFNGDASNERAGLGHAGLVLERPRVVCPDVPGRQPQRPEAVALRVDHREVVGRRYVR